MEAQPRYATLDGLRGVAAICVVLLHAGSMRDMPDMIPHGLLAVDFFLMLSGFIIALNYRNRLVAGAMTIRQFMSRRLARLYPMAFLGIALGALKLLSETAVGQGGADVKSAFEAIALNVALLPYWTSVPFRGEIFPACPPLWSLFAELVLNWCWALLCIWGALSRRALLMLLMASGIGSALYIFTDEVKVISYHDTLAPTLRVTSAFLIGVVLFELQDRLKSMRFPRILCGLLPTSLLMLIGLLMPIKSSVWDVLTIYGLFPLIMLAGMAETPKGENWLTRTLGNVSYPLYAVHFPILMMLSGARHKYFPDSGSYLVAVAGVTLSMVVALLAEYFYERHARQMIGSFLLRRHVRQEDEARRAIA